MLKFNDWNQSKNMEGISGVKTKSLQSKVCKYLGKRVIFRGKNQANCSYQHNSMADTKKKRSISFKCIILQLRNCNFLSWLGRRYSASKPHLFFFQWKAAIHCRFTTEKCWLRNVCWEMYESHCKTLFV